MRLGLVVFRAAVVWLITGTALIVLDPILQGLDVTNWRSALGVAALIGLLNALVWPLMIRFALPIRNWRSYPNTLRSYSSICMARRLLKRLRWAGISTAACRQ